MDAETRAELDGIKKRLDLLEGKPVVIPVVVPVVTPAVFPKDMIEVMDTDSILNLTDCPWIIREYWDALVYLSLLMQEKFPDRKASKTEIMEACGYNADCPGHPSGSHSDGRDVDLHYFTLGATNHTQKNGSDGPIVNIWTDGQLNNLFDTARNLEFVLSYRAVCPSALVIMDDRIVKELALAALNTYGHEKRRIILDYIQGSDTMNHDLHMHLGYNGKINLEAMK